MSIVDSVTSSDPSTSTALYATQPTRTPSQTLDASDFMQLLVTQLQNQDPTQPMDSSEMVQQTTQLGMMQELTQIASDSDSGLSLQARASAADLIGKTISYTDSTGAAASGVATGVSFSGTVPSVTVGNDTVPISSVLGVTPTPAS